MKGKDGGCDGEPGMREGGRLREREMVAALRPVHTPGTHLLPRHTGEVPQQSAPPVCPPKCANVAPDGV